MRYFALVICILCINTIVFAQTLEGKVYDSKSVVKDIKVFNKTQNRLTISDSNGNFSISAKVNDTISFQSLFYHPLEVVLKPSHFESLNVFEIKKIISQLDEVKIDAQPEQPVFTEVTYNQELKDLIKNDIKKNPQKYRPQSAQYGVDFIYLFAQVIKLFKKKNKKEKPPTYQALNYTQIDSLFSKSTFFNKRLLTKDLNIPEDKTKLFFDFCEAKGMSSELLQEQKKMMLLEELVLNSQLFLILLEASKEKKVNKD